MAKKIVVTDFKNTFEYLQALCKEAGTNITAVCRNEKIRRGTIQRWSGGDPLAIRILRKMETGISKIKMSNSKRKGSKK